MTEMGKETSQKPTEKTKHKRYTVLGQHLGGGPHGLGDPDDKTLRKVELDVLIMEKVRYKSRTEKCVDVAKAFNDCGKEAGLLLPFKCRAESAKLHECLKSWYENEEFKEQCKQEYLKERSEYRRTGIAKKSHHRGKRSKQESATQ